MKCKRPKRRTRMQHFYHVSQSPIRPMTYNGDYRKIGYSLKMNPRGNMSSMLRCDAEPDVPRICVAPTLGHCLMAVPLRSQTTYVYRTSRPKRAYLPLKIPDARITKERWLLSSTKFTLVQIIPERVMDRIAPLQPSLGCPYPADLMKQKQFGIWLEALYPQFFSED